MIIDPVTAVERWRRGGVGHKAATYAFNKIHPRPCVKVVVRQGKKRVVEVTGEVLHLGHASGKNKAQMWVLTHKPDGERVAHKYPREKVVRVVGHQTKKDE